MFAPKVRRSGQSLPCVRQRSGGAVLNDSPVGCQTRAMTEPQRDGGICKANDGGVVSDVFSRQSLSQLPLYKGAFVQAMPAPERKHGY